VLDLRQFFWCFHRELNYPIIIITSFMSKIIKNSHLQQIIFEKRIVDKFLCFIDYVCIKAAIVALSFALFDANFRAMYIFELYFEETNPLQSIRRPTFLSLIVSGWIICMMLQLIKINSHADCYLLRIDIASHYD